MLYLAGDLGLTNYSCHMYVNGSVHFTVLYAGGRAQKNHPSFISIQVLCAPNLTRWILSRSFGLKTHCWLSSTGTTV